MAKAVGLLDNFVCEGLLPLQVPVYFVDRLEILDGPSTVSVGEAYMALQACAEVSACSMA